MMDIEQNWQRITRWHAQHTPEGTLVLAEGASEAQIAKLEAVIGARLPDDLRHSLKLHNGQLDDGFLLYHGELLSVEQIEWVWQMYSDMQRDEDWGLSEGYETHALQGPIRPVHWDALRIPLTDNSGNAVMLDLLPAEGGLVGQLIEFDHETGPQGVIAPSFAAWLGQLADELEAGKHVYNEEAGWVAPPGT